jgi:predicted nucleic acid-binding protein
MAKVRLLVDTDILIDYLKKVKPARTLFAGGVIDIYCSILSKKELLIKPGLSSSERKKVINILSKLKILKIDNEINNKYMLLSDKYGMHRATMPDYIIAATAWAKNLPLLTRNKKHFDHIKKIRLVPPYQYEGK